MADNENSLSKLRPLPDDILAMAETETACHYCGISYLLLSKYEKMETHVKDMEAEMRYLKKYVDERPGMVSRLESLLQLQKHSAVTIGDLEKQLGETRRESEWNVKDLKVMKDKNSELSESLVCFLLLIHYSV